MEMRTARKFAVNICEVLEGVTTSFTLYTGFIALYGLHSGVSGMFQEDVSAVEAAQYFGMMSGAMVLGTAMSGLTVVTYKFANWASQQQ